MSVKAPTSMSGTMNVEQMLEEVCAENNHHLFDYHIPVADTPDF